MSPKLYWLNDGSRGRLAISARPRGGDWLEDEVEGWRREGINVVVSLLTEAENQEFSFEREADVSKAKGIEFHALAIEDRGVPAAANSEQLMSALASEIEAGKNLAIHCRQGIGRSSLISAAVLISRGDSLGEALAAIACARGLDVPETMEQKRWLERFAQHHSITTLTRNVR
jgi:protein-tyrosine phosphatase